MSSKKITATLQDGSSDDFELPMAPPAPPPSSPPNHRVADSTRHISSRSGKHVEIVKKQNVDPSVSIPPSDSDSQFDIRNPKSWNTVADKGDPLAMALLGDALCWGGFVTHGIDRDIPKGIHFLEESSHNKHPLGLFLLSSAQRILSGYRQHPNIADQTERSAVDEGFLDHNGSGGAIWWIAEAIAYREGRIVPIDIDRQLALIRRSIDSDYTDAWSAYAICLINGEGLPPNISEGVGWLKRATEMQNGTAMIHLANCYRNGIGVTKNAETALLLYNKAAQIGKDEAWNSLGFCIRGGIGCRRDDSEAFRCYHKAAETGNPSGLYNVGFCYEKGIGVKTDKKSAAFWYAKAVALGNCKAEEGFKRVAKYR